MSLQQPSLNVVGRYPSLSTFLSLLSEAAHFALSLYS